MSGCVKCNGTIYQTVGLCEDCSSLLEESQTTDIQQLKAEIAAAVEVFCHCPPIDLPKHIDVLVNKLRQLSAV